MARKNKTETAPTTLPPELPAVPVAEDAPSPEPSPHASVPAEPLKPLEQEQAERREKKPFIVVAAYDANDHSSAYHAAKIVGHLSQMKIEAQIVRRIDGGMVDLLVDASMALGPVVE